MPPVLCVVCCGNVIIATLFSVVALSGLAEWWGTYHIHGPAGPTQNKDVREIEILL